MLFQTLQNSPENTGTTLSFSIKFQIYRVNFINTEIPAKMFSCEFYETSSNIFFKESFGWLLLHKHSFCLLSQHQLSPFQKRCPSFFPAEYFLGLIFRLGTRKSSIFQTLSQNPETYFQPSQTSAMKFFCENS